MKTAIICVLSLIVVFAIGWLIYVDFTRSTILEGYGGGGHGHSVAGGGHMHSGRGHSVAGGGHMHNGHGHKVAGGGYYGQGYGHSYIYSDYEPTVYYVPIGYYISSPSLSWWDQWMIWLFPFWYTSH